VWTATLDLDGVGRRDAEALLSEAERERAQRVVSERSRLRLIAARAQLRRILGAYLGVAPARVALATDRQGKPFAVHPAELQFNLSHSDDRALFALTAGPPVGVDVERDRDVRRLDVVARRTLPAARHAELAALPSAPRRAAVLRAWTRREALLKGLGTGLGAEAPVADVGPLARRGRFSVELAGGEVWTVEDLVLEYGVTAAVAAPGTHWRVRRLGPHP